jgi:myosin heavy subunit
MSTQCPERAVYVKRPYSSQHVAASANQIRRRSQVFKSTAIISNLGDIQKQLSQILVEAKAQGHKIEDVIPEELQLQFQKMTELKAAREFIKDLESREKDLQAANATLRDKIKAKEAEIENQPAEFKALKVDLQQAHRHIDYYKELAEDSQRRAERYQRSLSNAVRDQIASEEAAAKISRLQTQLQQHQATILTLQEENRRAAETFDQLRTQDAQAMAANAAKLAEALSHASTVESESEQFSETFTTLIENLESEHCSAAASLNSSSARIRHQETLYNVIVSEVTPLNNFFRRAFSMLQIYQVLFQTLSDPSAPGIPVLPSQLESLMSAAALDLELYESVHSALREAEGVAQEQVREQLQGISGSAAEMLSSFGFIKGNVQMFLARLRREPGTWAALKATFIESRRWSFL